MNYEEIGEIRTFWPVFLPTTTTTTTTTINISFINNSTTLKMDKRVLFMAFVFTMVFHFNWKFIVLKENKLLKMFFQTLFSNTLFTYIILAQYNIIIVYFLSSSKSKKSEAGKKIKLEKKVNYEFGKRRVLIWNNYSNNYVILSSSNFLLQKKDIGVE